MLEEHAEPVPLCQELGHLWIWEWRREPGVSSLQIPGGDHSDFQTDLEE